MAAPPNKAAAPTAPVFIGMPAAPDELLEDARVVVAEPAAAILDVGAVTPEVKGTSVPELAPENAGVAEVCAGFAVAIVLLGFRTASITWTTPLLISTSGLMTLALLTNTVPLMTLIVRFCPPSVVTVVLDNVGLYATVPLMT